MTDIFGAGYRSLFLVELSEPSSNSLRVVVIEAAALRDVMSEDLKRAVTEVLPDPDRMAVEIVWESYILYLVRNESYASGEPGDAPASMLVQRQEPWFKAFVEQSTWARDDYPGEIQHWLLCCEDHVLDVATTKEPVVQRVPIEAKWLAQPRSRVFRA